MAELTDFLGKHILSGCEYNEIKVERWYSEKSNTLDFVLDGKEYRCIEDPNDGYRSALDEIVELPSGTVKNIFPECEVFGKMMPNDRYEKNEIVQLFDILNTKIVLEFGTQNYNDYYPMFIGTFHPENMAVNQ